MAANESKIDGKKDEKGFGEGIELVKDAKPEEKDTEINFGKVFSFFKKGTEKDEGKSEEKRHKLEHAEHYHKAKAEKEVSTAGKTEEAGGGDEIDLGKFASGVKGLFRSKKGPADEHVLAKEGIAEKSDEEISLNPKSLIEFFSTKGATILLIIAILFSMGLTAHVRLQLAGLSFTEEWAANSVYNIIQNDIQNALNTQYPNLPDARKNQILTTEMAKARGSKTYNFKTGQYAGQTIDIKSQIDSTASFFKDFYKDENGQRYSPDIDPYYWNRYAKNIVEKGHIEDEVRDGIQFDTYQLAPLGRFIAGQDKFFPYFLAYLYKFVRIFSHSATLWSVQTLVYPALVTALTVLLIFLIGRRIAGNVAGFFGSLMAGLQAAYVNRTIHGDNDAIVIFFAILTLWLFVEAIYSRKTILRLAFATLAGLSAAVFNLNWGGWWFIFAFILSASAATIAAGILYHLATAVIERKSLQVVKIIKSVLLGNIRKRFIIPTAVFFAATGLFVSIFTGIDRFLAIPQFAFGITTLKTPVLGASLWPNVLTTVAELNEGNFQQLVSQIRPGIFWLAASSAAMLLFVALLNFGLLKKYFKMINPQEEKALYAIFFAALLAVWYLGTIYSATKGIRFVLLITPMVGLGFGMALGLIYRLTMWINENYLKIHRLAVAATMFAILATATYSTDLTKNAYNIARHDVPIVNDAWHNALTAIREDSNSTTKDAIITSWWDFGHHFKSIADRRVTFDGTTQQGPQAHWVGKFFMTRNETEAAGILRMLDCGSNTAFDKLFAINQDFSGSIKILNKLTATPSKAAAKKTLTHEHNLTDKQAENVLQYTHCEHPPEGYVIASEDMIGKSGVWSHFGSWDFEKGIIWQTLRNKNEKEAVEAMKKMFNYSDEKAKSIYSEIRRIKNDNEANSWISPWPSFSGDITGCGIISNQNETDKIVRCGNGLIVNLTTHDAFFQVGDGSVVHPVSLVYVSNETGTEDLAERTYNESLVPQRLSVILVPQGNGFLSVVASPEDAPGMFTKMFFMGGLGLKHFKMLTHQTGLTGTNIYVYKADWESLK